MSKSHLKAEVQSSGVDDVRKPGANRTLLLAVGTKSLAGEY